MKRTKEHPEWMTDKEILEGMSDEELGVQITIADIERNHSECKNIERGATCIWVERAGLSSYPILDINNPADIMPLVFEAGITIATCPTTDCWVAISKCKKHAIEDNNPLRAAAIAYLLAGGWKND